MGFDLIEIPIEDPDLVDYGEARRLVQDHGLEVTTCAAMGGNRDLIHPDEEIREEGMDYLRTCIDAAEEVGASFVGGPLYSAVGRCWHATNEEREADTALLVNQLGGLAEYAADRNVRLLVEPLNRFETSFLNLASQVIDVVDQVDHPACQVLLDSFHLGIEETDPAQAIRNTGKRLKHFQVSENNRGIPGKGHLPWGEMAGALDEINYDGAVVIESFTADNESIARAAAIWQPLAPDQDTFAREGLEFLQKLFR